MRNRKIISSLRTAGRLRRHSLRALRRGEIGEACTMDAAVRAVKALKGIYSHIPKNGQSAYRAVISI